MSKFTWNKRAAIAAGGVALTTVIAAPALAVDYPPPASPSATPSTTSDNTTGGTTASDSTAYTGSNATVFGLIAGLAAVGIGGGLVIASRRKNA